MATATLVPQPTEPADSSEQAGTSAQCATSEESATSESGAERRGRRSAAPVLAMVGGLVALAAAATVLLSVRDGGAPAPRPQPASDAAVAADPLAITLSSRDVSIVTQVYEPGVDSGWHAHSGIHAVAVLSGTLTVYDAQCQPRSFRPGEPYVGGQDLHLVRNESDSPVEMSVTYLSPSTGAGPTRHLPAPAGCVAGRS